MLFWRVSQTALPEPFRSSMIPRQTHSFLIWSYIPVVEAVCRSFKRCKSSARVEKGVPTLTEFIYYYANKIKNLY